MATWHLLSKFKMHIPFSTATLTVGNYYLRTSPAEGRTRTHVHTPGDSTAATAESYLHWDGRKPGAEAVNQAARTMTSVSDRSLWMPPTLSRDLVLWRVTGRNSPKLSQPSESRGCLLTQCTEGLGAWGLSGSSEHDTHPSATRDRNASRLGSLSCFLRKRGAFSPSVLMIQNNTV